MGDGSRDGSYAIILFRHLNFDFQGRPTSCECQSTFRAYFDPSPHKSRSQLSTKPPKSRLLSPPFGKQESKLLL